MAIVDDRLRRLEGRPDRIERPGLQTRVCGAAAAHITVLVGPAGSGKSELLHALRCDPNAIYFRVGDERGTFARFVYGFAETIAPVAPGAQASFPRAWERALQSDSTSTVLAHWLCEHLAGIDRHIVIDDLHEGAADSSIAAFIGRFAELRPNAALTIAVRSVGALPIALWMATRRMERPIDEAALRFNRPEIVDTAKRFAVALDEATVEALLASTGGLPIAVVYALTQLYGDPQAFVPSMPGSYEEIAERIFDRRTQRERAFLFAALLFPSADRDLLARSGWNDAAAIRLALGSDAAFVWEPEEDGSFRFHDRFRDYLARRFQSCAQESRSALAMQTVRSLVAAGHYAGALEVATAQRLTGTVAELLDAHGFEVLERGAIDVISEALAAFADEAVLGASALALRGYMEARWGRLDTAEAWFRLGLTSAQDEASRVVIALYYAREMALRRREDACEVLEAFADSTTLPRSMLIDVRSAFGQALTLADRLAEATSRTSEALALLEANSPPALRARVFARAAYVALECGQPALARERARIAAPLAVAQSLYDVAASTYSVLYNVAYDIDDDAVASREYLECVRDLGIKSGTLRLDLYVMLGLYQLHAEAGDEPALEELGRALAHVDKHDVSTEIMETVLPAKALQAAWNGDFEAAQGLLRPTADRQATPARRALCWAQVGLYCAAAGDAERARLAFEKAQHPAARADIGTAHFSLNLLTLALGALICGDRDGARRWTRSADDATIGAAPRQRALRTVIEALIETSADADGFARVAGALAQLRDVQFGGIAKLIEALPYPGAASGRGTDTIGSVLARRELWARFAEAVESGDAGSLRGWLDRLPSPIFAGEPIVARFEGWAADRAGSDRRVQATLPVLRRQLAAYRRPAPAIAALVDDIDSAIDALFEHLDAAAPLMGEHSRAVSAWCSRLARVLGLTESEITFLTRCGLLHDIGKTRTPAEILQAPRQLTPDEWKIMRDHAAAGAEMIVHHPLLSAFAPIVRGHHERLDGQGYPDGLRLGAIPLAARIVSVADCFNAMIGRRPYRLPMAPTEALIELERHRGTQFDPEVVEAMVQIVLGRLPEARTLKT